MIEFTVTVPMHIAAVQVDGVAVSQVSRAFEQFQACATNYHSRHGASSPTSIEGVAVARRLFSTLGMDPTKTRPCSEALLRRALKGQSLRSVNNLVDVINWCALDLLLPICVYDGGKIRGPVVVRPGQPDETYTGLTGKEVNLEGRYVLTDDNGPFGNPVTDAQRTGVGPDTTKALAVVFAPDDYDLVELSARAQTVGERIVECCNGQITDISLYFLKNARA